MRSRSPLNLFFTLTELNASGCRQLVHSQGVARVLELRLRRALRLTLGSVEGFGGRRMPRSVLSSPCAVTPDLRCYQQGIPETRVVGKLAMGKNGPLMWGEALRRPMIDGSR